ncbi:MAG: aldose epimerase family protein [Oscillospiraceae bacterium]
MSSEIKEYGFYQGYKCYLVTLWNAKIKASFHSLGACIQSICVPDKNGEKVDVVLGYDDLNGYAEGNSSHGATVGRFANRIGGAKFTLNGKEYKLFKNDGENTLHGGSISFNKRVWTVDEVTDNSVTFGYTSPDGEENFPGTLACKVQFTLLDNGVQIHYTAKSDKDTVVNFTNHSYFNLKGEGSGDVLDHIVEINADKYTPVDSGLIPTGELADVAGTAFDFRQPKKVREDMDSGKLPNGYDHNFFLGESKEMRVAAQAYEQTRGILLTMKTNKPAMQFYIGIGLNEDGKGGKHYPKYGGLCFESQFCPDTPNKPNFPSCVLKAGETYDYTTIYEFDAK